MDTTATIFERFSALGDGTRSRLLTLLDGRELAVSDLCRVTRLPQSTVSRHLGILAADGWVTARSDGPHRRYRMAADLAPDAAALWTLVRDELSRTDPWPEDAERVEALLAEAPDRSRAFFSASAGRWDELRARLYGRRADLLPLLGLLDPGIVVGDLGGGTGHTTLALAPFVSRVVLVDRSREMLRAARRRLASFANVELRTGELTALPVADGELDLAVLSLVLHYVDDPQAALVEASRALVPGGRLVVVDLRPHDRDRYREEMGHRWQGFESDQLRGWLEGAGFRDVLVRPLPADPEAEGPLLLMAAGRRTGRARGARTVRSTRP
jgi:ArsR family transcriptional regulator